jgi:hypothetical protein
MEYLVKLKAFRLCILWVVLRHIVDCQIADRHNVDCQIANRHNVDCQIADCHNVDIIKMLTLSF